MRLRAFLWSLLLLAWCADTHAQDAWAGEEPSLPQRYDASRTLNGHAFIPFREQPWPFVSTRVASRTGMGITNLTSIPVLNLGTIDEDAKLVSFSQSFDADIKLARFIALSLGFGVGHAAGINESGAFNLGVNYLFGGRLGLIIRLAQGKHWYLSIRGDVSQLRAEAVLPVALTQTAVVTDGEVTFDLGSLTQGGDFRLGSGFASFMVSPLRWLGLQLDAGFEAINTETGSRESRREFLLFSLGSSYRLNQLGVPLAFQLGFSARVRVGDDDPVYFPTVSNGGDFTWNVEFGVLYSEPKYVDVGVQTSLRYDDDDKRTQFQIVLNHVW